ncbi:MAG: hypothetical protein R2750_05760 [Bacteroidales bacterium]
MKAIKKIWSFILFDTYGNIALASFLICIASGVILAIPYDVMNAYDSINLLVITNLPGVVFRNMHYWSAQFFLIFTLLHTWEHIRLKSAKETGTGIWFRLILSILFVFYVMLSGFILKADADSLQARRILETLLLDIPLLGTSLNQFIFGKSEDLLLTYVHHIATATIFLIYIIYEHAGILWSKRSTFLIVLALLTFFSFFVQAPLHDGINPVLKGPWYFVGLQEVLHWMSQPGWIWTGILVFLTILFIMKYFSDKNHKFFVRIILFLSAIYLGLTIIGFYFRGENWKWETPWDNQNTSSVSLRVGFQKVNTRFNHLTSLDIPQIKGKRETCMNCHTAVSGFSPAHDPMAIGCTSCHLGDPFAWEKDEAHKNMILIPGNLGTAQLSCGTNQCHPEIPGRLNSSLMTTNSGIVSVNRFVFREVDSPDEFSHIKEIGHSAADKHLHDLCAKCHLGNEKTETGPIDQLSSGGGCIACHLNYTEQSANQHLAYISGKKAEYLLPSIHPSLDLKITNDHCFGCHSGSGRISTNYEGWHETLFDESEVSGKEGYRILQDKRVFKFIAADVHHTAGLDCIDCHNSYEVMGDGNIYLHKEHAVKIRCEDCHFDDEPNTLTYAQLDAESKKIFDLRKFAHAEKKMIIGSESGIALINTYLENDSAFLVGKNTGKIHPLNPPTSVCTKDHAHESLTCSSCHTAWAPQCIGCHNEFDKTTRGFDLLDNKFFTGEWVEFVGTFLADQPTLGVREGINKKTEPAIPGMILTIDKTSFDSTDESMIFHRLYAPAAPHTTNIKGRTCKSCHNNPLAIGYGRGELNYEINERTGQWKFTPEFAPNKYDGLPEDAWIEFLQEAHNVNSTRTDFRPFTIEEQKQILTVGACLTCHEENSETMNKSLDEEFSNYLQKLSDKCILPNW